MGFWQWYLGGIIRRPSRKLLVNALTSAGLEYVAGMAVLVLVSVGMLLYSFPWGLFISLPVGFTIAAHGWWRAWGK